LKSEGGGADERNEQTNPRDRRAVICTIHSCRRTRNKPERA
jgi:hypothetical protein